VSKNLAFHELPNIKLYGLLGSNDFPLVGADWIPVDMLNLDDRLNDDRALLEEIHYMGVLVYFVNLVSRRQVTLL